MAHHRTVMSACTQVICGADLLVHEATNACTALDRAAGVKPADVHQSARRHGHSTPDMAGRLAKKVKPNPPSC